MYNKASTKCSTWNISRICASGTGAPFDRGLLVLATCGGREQSSSSNKLPREVLSTLRMEPAVPFSDDSLNPAVRGWVHTPHTANGDAMILTHGAGSDCNAPLLVALAEAFVEHGYTVLRCDLPFRQERRFGPPNPGNAERD